MKTFLISLAIAVSMALALPADAKSRFGSGKSTGMQRDSAKPAAAATPPSAASTVSPAAAPAAASTAAATAAKPAAAAAPAAAGNKWLGPLAGLAAGGLLASMFMGGGMGGFGGFKIFDFIILIGFAVAAFYLFRMWRNRSNSNNSAPSNLQYAGAGNNAPDYAPAPIQRASSSPSSGGSFATPEIGSRLQAVASPAEANALAQAPRIPADFAVEPFARHARGAFIRMQAANDVGDKADIRDFTTPEMYAEISMQIQERKGETQRTDVTKLDVTVLEVVTENSKAIASVRFTGELQFDGETQVEKFDEVWHVVKRVDEQDATWLVAGIQQLS